MGGALQWRRRSSEEEDFLLHLADTVDWCLTVPENTKEGDAIWSFSWKQRQATSGERCISSQREAKGTSILRNKHRIHANHENVGLGSFKNTFCSKGYLAECKGNFTGEADGEPSGTEIEDYLWWPAEGELVPVRRIVVRKMHHEVINRTEKDPKSWSHFKYLPGPREVLYQQVSESLINHLPSTPTSDCFSFLSLLWTQKARKRSSGCPLSLLRESSE